MDNMRAPIVGTVLVLSFMQLLWLGMMLMGVNTSCTNAYSCSSSYCAPCRIVTWAIVGGAALTAVAGALAIAGPWSPRVRLGGYVAAILAIAVCTLLVAQSW